MRWSWSCVLTLLLAFVAPTEALAENGRSQQRSPFGLAEVLSWSPEDASDPQAREAVLDVVADAPDSAASRQAAGIVLRHGAAFRGSVAARCTPSVVRDGSSIHRLAFRIRPVVQEALADLVVGRRTRPRHASEDVFDVVADAPASISSQELEDRARDEDAPLWCRHGALMWRAERCQTDGLDADLARFWVMAALDHGEPRWTWGARSLVRAAEVLGAGDVDVMAPLVDVGLGRIEDAGVSLRPEDADAVHAGVLSWLGHLALEPRVVPHLDQATRHSSAAVRHAAWLALCDAGVDLVGRVETTIRSAPEDVRYAAVMSVGSRLGSQDAASLLARLTADRVHLGRLHALLAYLSATRTGEGGPVLTPLLADALAAGAPEDSQAEAEEWWFVAGHMLLGVQEQKLYARAKGRPTAREEDAWAARILAAAIRHPMLDGYGIYVNWAAEQPAWTHPELTRALALVLTPHATADVLGNALVALRHAGVRVDPRDVARFRALVRRRPSLGAIEAGKRLFGVLWEPPRPPEGRGMNR